MSKYHHWIHYGQYCFHRLQILITVFKSGNFIFTDFDGDNHHIRIWRNVSLISRHAVTLSTVISARFPSSLKRLNRHNGLSRPHPDQSYLDQSYSFLCISHRTKWKHILRHLSAPTYRVSTMKQQNLIARSHCTPSQRFMTSLSNFMTYRRCLLAQLLDNNHFTKINPIKYKNM